MKLRVLMVCLMIAMPVPALAGGVRVAGPLVRLDPTAVDFGRVTQGDMLTFEVTVHNDGSEALQIISLDSDCGCTVAELPDSLLSPGEATQIKLTLQTRTFSGKITKHVFVKTNDPSSPRATLPLSANVRPTVVVQPTAIEFGTLRWGETRRASVRITAAVVDSLHIAELDFPEQLLTTQLDHHVEGDTLVYELRLDLRPDAVPGPFSIHGGIRTNLTGDEALPIHLSGQIHGFFQVDPPSFSFGQIRQGRSKTCHIRLTGQGSGSHQVLRATCGSDLLQPEVVAIEEGRIYEVRLTISPEAPPGRVNTSVRIETDDPIQPEFSLDARGRVRRARERRTE